MWRPGEDDPETAVADPEPEVEELRGAARTVEVEEPVWSRAGPTRGMGETDVGVG